LDHCYFLYIWINYVPLQVTDGLLVQYADNMTLICHPCCYSISEFGSDNKMMLNSNKSNLIQNSPAVKKCAAPRRPLWKKMWNPRWPRWQPRNGCDGKLMEKFLITTIQVNLCCLLHVSLGFGTKFTRIVVIKILPLTYHHSHFLATALDFLGPQIFFTAGLFFD